MPLSPKGCAGHDGDAQAARWTAAPLDRRADSRGEGETGARGGAVQEGGRAGAWFSLLRFVHCLVQCQWYQCYLVARLTLLQEDVQSVLATPAQTA